MTTLNRYNLKPIRLWYYYTLKGVYCNIRGLMNGEPYLSQALVKGKNIPT
ncbi:hypothetical protein ALTERO38_20148 [Alteromonas sp. 38]|nr:hypothetical protein ALTER154_100391 [Alteromonas sp. 154]VXA99072.1 hypothetical protein ALTERO38_20148 [Alteromonas sp. 38]